MTPVVERRVDALYRRRLQSLQAVDEAIATLIHTLKRNGQLRDTYVVFTSDNGYHLGQHRMPAGKETAYEEDIHVPLMVRGPGVPARSVVSQLTGNVDLAPTFAELAHAPIPAFVDGQSLVPLLRGRSQTPRGWRRAYLVEHWLPAGAPAPTAGGGAPVEPLDDLRARRPVRPLLGTRSLHSISHLNHRLQRLLSRIHAYWWGATSSPPNLEAGDVIVPEFHGIRTHRHLYVEYMTGERELYDLKRDRAELHNLAATARPRLLHRLAAWLARLTTCQGTECRDAEQGPPRASADGTDLLAAPRLPR